MRAMAGLRAPLATQAAALAAMILALQFAAMPSAALAAALQPYGSGSDSADSRFGAQIGAGSAWQPVYAPASHAAAQVGFGGSVSFSCDHIDFKAFVAQFNPGELLHDMKDQMIHGAQQAVFDYLIALAYSSPTVASVLDMMDQRLSARFAAFAQGCNAQQARRSGEDAGARRMADASDQCFMQQVNAGASPTEAYRSCAIEHTFGGLDLPALAGTLDFLHRYTNLTPTREIEALLNLLPDERIDQGVLQMRPASVSVAAMTEGLRLRARAALDSIEAGTDPGRIASCGAADLSGDTDNIAACLPPSASALVASPAFRAARLLNVGSRELYKDALSGQIATVAAYSNVLELQQQIARLDVKPTSGASAGEAVARRDRLADQASRLLGQADTQLKIEEAKLRLARTQVLALERVEARLDAAGAQLDAESRPAQRGVLDFLRLFVDRQGNPD
jgi:hypothetical protein